ncbi:kinase-like domain-containing protein [Chytriomyces sp. MP71]|nr:kinase-like domain-containing protein [Chytriomyces sp. MP71]
MAWRALDKFKITKQLGDGTFGCVLLGVNIMTGEKVAIKKMKKLEHFDESLRLREVKALAQLGKHKNIIKLKEMIRDRRTDELNLVFEFMDGDLFSKMRDLESRGEFFEEIEVKKYIYQLMLGLDHMHRRGLFHRDMKPENLLITGDVLKIADFGLAKELSCEPPFSEYVTTRWYRAPEVLLKSTTYSAAIDIWGAATIFAEIITLQAIFPGDSSIDEIYKICTLLGTPRHSVIKLEMDANDYEDSSASCDPKNYYSLRPTPERSQIMGGGEWNEAYELASAMGGFEFPQMDPVPLEQYLPNASTESLQLIADMMRYDPRKRPTAGEVLSHGWFDEVRQVKRNSRSKRRGTFALFQKAKEHLVHKPQVITNEIEEMHPVSSVIRRQSRSTTRSRVKVGEASIDNDDDIATLPELPSKQANPKPIFEKKISEIEIEVGSKSRTASAVSMRDFSDPEKKMRMFDRKQKHLENMLGALSVAEEDPKDKWGQKMKNKNKSQPKVSTVVYNPPSAPVFSSGTGRRKAKYDAIHEEY